MKIINLENLSAYWPELIEALRQGGVIAYPTDTLYGLGCDVFSKVGMEKVWSWKGREAKKPISMICADIIQLRQYAIINKYANDLIKQILPGSFTIILPAMDKVPSYLCSEGNKVGIRLPKCPAALEMVRHLGYPVTATSANLAGRPPCETVAEIIQLFPDLDYVIDAGRLKGPGSTVIDVTGEEIQIVREGVGQIPF